MWQTLLLPTNRKTHVSFRLAYLDLTLTLLNIKVMIMRITTANISKTVIDGTNIAIAIQYKVTYGLSITTLILELTTAILTVSLAVVLT